MTTIHFMDKGGITITNVHGQKMIPFMGDTIIAQISGKGNYHYTILNRRFVYDWNIGDLLFVEITLEMVKI